MPELWTSCSDDSNLKANYRRTRQKYQHHTYRTRLRRTHCLDNNLKSFEMPKTTNPLIRHRSSPSPLKITKRNKAKLSTKSNLASQVDTSERLDDTGLTPSLAPRNVSQDVSTLIRYIHAHTFTDIPERGAGMGSERISEILRFRAALPRIVSIAHLHALSSSPTETERELARLIARGAVRKVVVPGRGKGGASVGEGIVLDEDWRTSVRESKALGEEVKEKYLQLLDASPGGGIVSTSGLQREEVQELVQAGYLISPSALLSNLSDLFARPGAGPSLSQSGSKAATGTLAAVGGHGAIHESGGGGSTLATSSSRIPHQPQARIRSGQTMTFSLPSTGSYLNLLTTARQHLLNLLKQLSPRYKEATIDVLKQKWDGNIPNDAVSRKKRERGEWTGVLPGKTKKWREFFGLEFEWVLEECVGSGLVEAFETGIGVVGVRAV